VTHTASGRFVRRALRGYGVGDQYVTAVSGLPTPVTFCEIFPPDDFPIYFYRYPKAPDLEIRPGELDYDAIRAAGVFWREQARRHVQAALPLVSVAAGNLDECDTAVGEREPHRAARALRGHGVDLAVVKQGPRRQPARNPDRYWCMSRPTRWFPRPAASRGGTCPSPRCPNWNPPDRPAGPMRRPGPGSVSSSGPVIRTEIPFGLSAREETP
jgi:sugar/nucleoside kinase (ribokinase family)